MRAGNRRTLLTPRIAAVALALGAGESRLAAEEVSLSRYKLPLTTVVFAATPVDPTVMDAFCRDDDGCLVTLRFDSVSTTAAGSGRLFLSVVSNRWAKAADVPGTHFDGDLNLEPVLDVLPPGGTGCRMTDGETGIADEVPGFSLAGLGGTCVLVLVD